MPDLGIATHSKNGITTSDIEGYLSKHADFGLLRLTACGRVDGGRRMLIGRLLVDEDVPSAGQIASVRQTGDAAFTDGGPDPVLLNTAAEASFGAAAQTAAPTGDRFFLARPGTGSPQAVCSSILQASDNDIALLIVSALTGITSLARRHAWIVSHAGFDHVILLVTDMDQVGHSRETFDLITADFRAYAARLGIEGFAAVPTVASSGDNMLHRAESMPWYQGPTLAALLGNVELDLTRQRNAPFHLLVQHAQALDGNQQECSGIVASGTIRPGGRIRIQPMGRESRVASVLTGDRDVDEAVAGQSVTLVLQDAPKIGPGSIISTTDAPAEVADQFEARIVWLHEQPLYPGRKYLLKIGGNTIGAVVTDIKYEVNVDNLDHLAANKLELNGIAACNLALDRPIPFAPYEINRDMGGFLLVDRLSGETVGVGLLNFALRRAHNIHLQHVDTDKQARIAHKGHRPCVLWFTGLSGSGKSTIANLVERRLHALGAHTYLLDGDNVRHGLSRDLGFTDADRVENIRRVAEVSRLMVDAGLIVITAFISPFRAERRMARQLLEEEEFFEIFTDTPLEVAERRDPKGLYKKARRGDLKNFTGIDSPYERPEAPEVWLDTATLNPELAADKLIEQLKARGVFFAATPTRDSD